MTNKGQKAVTPRVVRVLRALGLAGLYARFAPEVRRGNQPDMPIITNNKIWFLRESRFLVFTRGGPVEVTLKPSLVLTGSLCCMAGVAVIFYSTVIASFGAIEVMREETIKTAQARSTLKDGAAFSKDDTFSSALKWFDYNPTSLEDSHPPSIIGKLAQPPSLIVGRIITQPSVTTPQTPQTSPKATIAEDAKTVVDDAMPMIIQGGKRVTLASNAASANPEFGNDVTNMASKPQANDASSPEMMPMSAEQSLADQKSVRTVARKANRMPKIDAEQIDGMEAGTNVTATSNPPVENDVKPASIAARAQEFAIALLPNFASAPKDQKPAQSQPDENNSDAIGVARLSPPSPELPEQPAATAAALPAAPACH